MNYYVPTVESVQASRLPDSADDQGGLAGFLTDVVALAATKIEMCSDGIQLRFPGRRARLYRWASWLVLDGASGPRSMTDEDFNAAYRPEGPTAFGSPDTNGAGTSEPALSDY